MQVFYDFQLMVEDDEVTVLCKDLRAMWYLNRLIEQAKDGGETVVGVQQFPKGVVPKKGGRK